MLNRSFILGPAVILTFTSFITLGGCSSGDDDTTGAGGTGGTTASGGSGASGGTGGTTASGGAGGSVANAGTGNSNAGAGGCTKMQPLPTLTDCNPVASLTGSCAMLGCHKGAFASSKMELTPDMCFVSRLKDVAATHTDIPCADGTLCGTIPPACPSGDKLIDSDNVNNSWMLHKLQMMPNGCGDSMPPAGYTIDDAGRACVVELVKAIAALPK